MRVTENKKPRQRISIRSKTKSWVEDNVRYWTEVCRPIVDKNKSYTLYRAAFGKLDEKEYLYVTNPLNTNRKELKGYPSKMRNYPILPTTVNVLMGEKTARPIDNQVIVTNSNLKSRILEAERKAVIDYMVEDLMKRIDVSQMSEEQAQQAQQQMTAEDPSISRLINRARKTVKDELAIMGQEALDYIMFHQDVRDKMIDQMLDVLCVNACVTYRDVHKDNVIYNVVYPDEISISSNNNRYIDESEGVVREFQMTESELMDFFEGATNFKELKAYIKGDDEGNTTTSNATSNKINGTSELDPGRWARMELFDNLFGFRSNYIGDDNYTVKHVVWKSSTKFYLITGYNEMTGEYGFEASEDYELMDGESKEEMYRDQYWECYEVDNRICVGYAPIDTTLAKGDNPYNSINPYNGIILDGISVVEMGLVFQIKHNIFEYYIEKLIGKHKGDIILMPKQLIPKDEEMDIYDFFYYTDSTGISFVDVTDKEQLLALQYVKVLNTDLGKALKEIIALKQENLNEWKELIGSTRQREGRVNASDGKAVTEEAIFRSSLLTEYIFSKVDRVHRRDQNALIDLSQLAWINGKKGSYISSDFRKAYLEINPEVYPLCEFGIGVTNDPRNEKRMRNMQQYTQAMAQDPNFPKHLIPRIESANNITQMVDEIEEIMMDLEERQAKAAQAQQQAETDKVNKEDRRAQEELAFKYYKVDEDNEAKRDVAMLSSDTAIGTALLTQEGGQAGQAEIARANRTKERLEENALRASSKSDLIKAATEKYKADVAYKIAKENKQPHEVKSKK